MIEFRRIPFDAIDKKKWNSCVHFSPSGNVFQYHWYLTAVLREWDALVEGDYDGVFPVLLPGDDQITHQPALIRELSLSSTKVFSRPKREALAHALQQHLQLSHIAVSENFASVLPPGHVRQKQNYILNLYRPYEEISADYHPALRETLEKHDDAFYASTIQPDQLISFLYNGKPKDQTAHMLMRLMYNALHRGIGHIVSLKERNSGTIAVGFFVYSHGKIVCITRHSDRKWSRWGESLLFDYVIRTHAGRPLLLDFNSDTDDFGQFHPEVSTYYISSVE